MRSVIYLRVSTKEQAEKGLSDEGYSIPAQRDACVQYIRSQGWELVDEYVDRGESARSADRPQLQSLLSRIAKDGDVDAIIVHKVDRLARNMEDHVAIRAALRRYGVSLFSVTENLEESASGRLVEGIHALMAEFYSSNLANEVRKGMSQKAKMGGWPHRAPIGYKNVKDTIGGRLVTQIIPDPDRAMLIRDAFSMYATGDWTLASLHAELVHKGLRNQRGTTISMSTLARTLANKAYVGIIEWHGAEYPGLHEPLVSQETFDKVQRVLASRAARGTRERKHNHYLKGILWCGVCGRRLSFQPAKEIYTYYYCLGQKNANRTGCRERFVSADILESAIELLYDKVQLSPSWLAQLRENVRSEIAMQQSSTTQERDSLNARKSKVEAEKDKLMDAYYAGAVDIDLLKSQQQRLRQELVGIEERLSTLSATTAEWQDILELAMTFATQCGRTYKKASDSGRRTLNKAVIDRIEVREGKVVEVRFQEPFDLLFSGPEFEYERLAVPTGFEPVYPP